MALSSFVGLQPDSPLTGNLSSRWGHPGLVPPEARDPAARRASQRALGRAGLVRAGTQGDMRGGRAGPGAPSGWSQPSPPRPACHPGGTVPPQEVSAGCSPTGRVLGPFRLLSRTSSESRLLVKTLSSPPSQVLPYRCRLFSFPLAFCLQGARKTTFVNGSCLSLEEAE